MRFFHRFGFGIHSPWAYSLIRNVLFEKLRYYAFDELKQKFPHRNHKDIDLDEQIFRIVNHFKPSFVLILGTCEDSTINYIHSADNTLKIVIPDPQKPISSLLSYVSLFYIGAHTPAIQFAELLSSKDMIVDDTVMVIDGINKEHRQLWQYMLNFKQSAVTFDMKYRGLIFFDSKRSRQNYKV